MESHLLGLPHLHIAYLQEVSRDHYKAHFICFLILWIGFFDRQYHGKHGFAVMKFRIDPAAVRFGYRRTAEEQAAIVNATSTEALPDLLRAAIREEG